jgi:PAS domain S-box-containing protein
MSPSTFEALLRSNAFVEFDVDGQILWANQNFLNLLCYDLAEIKNQHHSIFLPDYESHKTHYEEMWTQLIEGQEQAGEYKRLNRNKKDIWLQGTYIPVKAEDGKITKVINVVSDITEKKNLSECLETKKRELVSSAAQVQMASQAKSILLANMSHEIRTPLNTIIGLTETLAETPLDDQQLTFVATLQKANAQLFTLINDILDLSQMTSGEVSLRPISFHIKDLINEVSDLWRFKIKEQGLELNIEIEKEVEKVFFADADRIRQVLFNLFSNSLKFTKKGAIKLTVQKNCSLRPGTLLFSLSDTGIGIPKKYLPQLFEPFNLGDNSRSRKHNGSGMGLAISKNLVDQLGGHIWVESRLHQGSTFNFTVTAITKNRRDQKAKDAKTASGANTTSSLNILVVDDIVENINLFKIFLKGTPHKIVYASSGFEALKLTKNEAFDVIFMDIQMPGMDGLETTQRIRDLEQKTKREKKLKIIACTANSFPEDIQLSLKAGCDQHLAKPIRKETILKSLNGVPS